MPASSRTNYPHFEDAASAHFETFPLTDLSDQFLHLQCPKCSENFLTSSLLRTHLSQAHGQDLPYTCTQCGKDKYKSSRGRDRKNINHMSLISGGNKSTSLPSVNRKPVSQFAYSLEPHLSSLASIVCPICQETFLDRGNFKSHMSQFHGNVMPFTCTLCSKGYASLSGLSLHMQAHEGKTYLCPICKLGAQRWSLHDKSFKKGTRNYVNTSRNYHVKKQQTIGYISPLPSENVIQKDNLSKRQSHILRPTALQLPQNEFYTSQSSVKTPALERYSIHGPALLESVPGLRNHSAAAIGTQFPFSCRLCGKGYLRHEIVSNPSQELSSASNSSNKLCHYGPGSHSTFSSSGSLGCPYCSQVFSCDYYLKSHLSDVHGSMMPFTCRLCGKGYLSQRGLIHHKHAHFGKKFMCPVCGKRFTQKFTSKTHLRNIHNSTQCRLAPLAQSVRQDDQTSQTFMDQMFKSKKVHKSTLGMRGPMSLDGINNFLCPNCNLEFPNKSALQSHNSECLKCSICAVKFSYKHELKMHLSQQHELRRIGEIGASRNYAQRLPMLTFSCNFCSQKFMDEKLLQSHIVEHQNNELPFTCHLCGKDNIRYGTNKNILRSASEGPLKVLCSPYRQSADSLPLGPKDISRCRHCNIELFAANLKKHLSEAHGYNMPFHCSLCGKGFLSTSGLYHHKRNHAGQKFRCPICDVTFTQKSKVKRHLISIHGCMPCSTCDGVYPTGSEYDQHVLHCKSHDLKFNSFKS
ncbi:GDNF-inducible zinc finger protein 1 isoform X10 [Biomphalaria glabrata]|nr:GDNF-inducible zinc finger protein 1 isoform X10 [Biomphalaria glabrata]